MCAPGRLASTATVLTVLAVAGCVSHPRSVGPTALLGTLPPPAPGRVATAGPDPAAGRGPLSMQEPAFTWIHASPTGARFRWQCRLENPSHRSFRVTVIATLLDEGGREVRSDSQALEMEGDEEVVVGGEGTVDPDQAGRIAGWRLEYWVELSKPPLRF